jgi:hypothetical protein
MNFPPELQEEVEQWAKSAGLSVQEFIIQVVSERLTWLRQQKSIDGIESSQSNPPSLPSNLSRMYRKQGVLVIETGRLREFDINAFVGEMREERIQDQIEQVNL